MQTEDTEGQDSSLGRRALNYVHREDTSSMHLVTGTLLQDEKAYLW